MVNGQLLIDNREYTTIDMDTLQIKAKAGAIRCREAIGKRHYRPL